MEHQRLRSNRKDFDIVVGEFQPEVICLQEAKLEHSPQPKTYQCANYDCYNRVLKGRPEQLSGGGVPIYVKKGLYHKPIQLGTNFQAIKVQVMLGGTPVILLPVYMPSSEHLKNQELPRLLRCLNGQISRTGDFNGHNYSWGSHQQWHQRWRSWEFHRQEQSLLTQRRIPTYLKPQAQHSENPTSALPSPSVHLNWPLEVHGSSLTHMVVTTIRPW